MKPKVVGLVSPDGSGKDYFYERALKVASGFKTIQRFAFADMLQEEVSIAVSWVDFYFGVEHVDIEDCFDTRSKKELVRDLLKGWGMLRRNLYGEDYWAKKAIPILTKDYDEPTLLIFTDVSYQNEIDIIDSLIGEDDRVFVRLRRTDSDYKVPDPNSHSSSWGRANLVVDFEFDNDKIPQTMDHIVRQSLSIWGDSIDIIP